MPKTFQLTLPAEPCSLRAVRAFVACIVEQAGCSDREQVVLALDEACANVIKHRCTTLDDGQLRLTIEREPDRLRFRIACFCLPAEVARVKPRDFEQVRPGGLGTAFIAKIMDRVTFETDPDGRSVTLVLEKNLQGNP